MYKHSHTNSRSTKYRKKKSHSNQKPVKRVYIVSPQTAYHVQELALQEDTTEGRIIDKIMRSYLCNRATMYEKQQNISDE